MQSLGRRVAGAFVVVGGAVVRVMVVGGGLVVSTTVVVVCAGVVTGALVRARPQNARHSAVKMLLHGWAEHPMGCVSGRGIPWQAAWMC
jgi:hypothetical protein